MAAGQSEPLKVQLRSIGKIDTFLETNMAVYSFIRATLLLSTKSSFHGDSYNTIYR